MRPAIRHLQVSVGFATEAGLRSDNQDFGGACIPTTLAQIQHGVAVAVADGVGGNKGGRVAAETSVRAFLDAFYAMPETIGALRAAARSIEAINGWIYAQGRTDPALENMSTTFSALILRRRRAHVLHVGDSRVYRLSDGRLEQLTTDHVAGRGDLSNVLVRAVGAEDVVRFDHTALPLSPRDRFLLCSDGVHGVLDRRHIGDLLGRETAPDEVARSLVDEALASGSADNVTALVLDVLDVPSPEPDELRSAIGTLPLLALPEAGATIDDFHLEAMLSDGRYSRVFSAIDTKSARRVVLKFPSRSVATETSFRLAFLREAWVATRMRNSGIGEVIELPPERQTRLYSVMPFYEGVTLEDRLMRAPPIPLAEGIAIATQAARALTALHRARVMHRDIKPDNIILSKEGGVRIIDLGVAYVPELEDFPLNDNPGTPSYMAPELFEGAQSSEATDLYALGVTIYQMFTRHFPYGAIEPPRTKRRRYTPLTQLRPDLPAWLDVIVARAVSERASKRQGDVLEIAYELENSARWTLPATVKTSRYERNPVLIWQTLCAVLIAICAILIATR